MTDSEGFSPLAVALYNDKREVERYLRDQGCTLGDSELFAACECGRLDIVTELVEVDKCDPSSKQCHECLLLQINNLQYY